MYYEYDRMPCCRAFSLCQVKLTRSLLALALPSTSVHTLQACVFCMHGPNWGLSDGLPGGRLWTAECVQRKCTVRGQGAHEKSLRGNLSLHTGKLVIASWERATLHMHFKFATTLFSISGTRQHFKINPSHKLRTGLRGYVFSCVTIRAGLSLCFLRPRC